jgi:hypothetical protein
MLPADEKVEELTELLAKRDQEVAEFRQRLSAATGGDSGGSITTNTAEL